LSPQDGLWLRATKSEGYAVPVSTFPATRLRRLRRTTGLRRLARETRLDPDHFLMPLFIRPGPLANPELPGLARHSGEALRAAADDLERAGG